MKWIIRQTMAIVLCFRRVNRRKVFTAFVILSFVAYLFIAGRLLIFRNAAMFSQALESIGLPRYHASYNLIPFRTIIGFVKALANRSLTRSIPIENLVGNLLAFMPLGFFLPFLIKKMAALKMYAITVSGLIISIELLQFILRVGSLDIDDFILNLVGALIGFAICTHRPVCRLLALRAYESVTTHESYDSTKRKARI